MIGGGANRRIETIFFRRPPSTTPLVRDVRGYATLMQMSAGSANAETPGITSPVSIGLTRQNTGAVNSLRLAG